MNNENIGSPLTRRAFLAGVGLTAGGVVLSACGGSTSGGAVPSGTSGGGATSPTTSLTSSGKKKLTTLTSKPVTLTYWVLPSSQELAWATAWADDFHKVHPNITVNVVKSATLSQSVEATITAAVGHKLPDLIFSADVNTLFQASKGILLDMTPYMAAYGISESEFVGKIMQLGQYQGKQYVIPRGVDQVCIAYNPELFDKFKVPYPKLGWSWAEFLATSKELTRTVNGTKYYALGGGSTSGTYAYTGYPIYVPFMKGWGGKLSTGSGKAFTATMDSPAVVKGITNMFDYLRSYTPQLNAPPRDPFIGGTAAMGWVTRPTVFGSMVNSARTNWVVDFEPQFTNFALFPTPEIGAGMAGVAATVDTKHPNEAAAFLAYTMSKRGATVFSKAAAEVPIRKDLKTSHAWQDALVLHGKKIDQRAFVAYAQDQSYPPQEIPIAANPQMAQAVSTAFDDIRLKKKTPAAALKTMNATINQVLGSGSVPGT